MSLQDLRDNLSIRVLTYTTNSMDQLCPIFLLSYAPGSAVSHEYIYPEWTRVAALLFSGRHQLMRKSTRLLAVTFPTGY